MRDLYEFRTSLVSVMVSVRVGYKATQRNPVSKTNKTKKGRKVTDNKQLPLPQSMVSLSKPSCPGI